MIFLYFSFLGAFFGKPLWCWNSACLLVTVVVISQTKPSLRSQSLGTVVVMRWNVVVTVLEAVAVKQM